MDVQQNLAGLAFRLGLEAQAQPAVLLVGPLIIAGGDGIGEDKKTRRRAALLVQAFGKHFVFAIEHGH